MKKLIETFVKYPFYANMLIITVLLVGGISLFDMKRSFFPERTSRFIFVNVAYPGASPKEMEEGITTRIENAIKGVIGIKEVTSTSSENFSSVRIETTGKYDIDDVLMDVKNSIDGISSFPVSAERPIVFKQRSRSAAMYISMYGNVDLLTLKEHAQDVEDDMLNSGVMSQVNLNGYPPLEISVEVDEETLLRYNITINEISNAISRNNRDLSAGMIKSDDQEILIRSRKRSVKPNDIGEIIVRALPDGRFLFVKDLAEVKQKFADVSFSSTMNGERAVYFFIAKLIDEDLEEITQFTDAYVKNFNNSHSGVKMEITFKFAELLKSRIDLLIKNGITGLLLVLITLSLFLNFRLSAWVAAGIPFSFLAMFVVANMIGVTVNMISLFGMILVIGILVDDGIVIAENIYVHFEKGKTPARAAIDGTMEVLPAVTTSVLTTITAFLPVALITGQMEMLGDMALIVIFSLGFSLLEAFFILPAHLGTPHILRRKSLEKKEMSKSIRGKLNSAIMYMRDNIYGKALKVIIKWRYVFLFVPLAIVIIVFGMINGGVIKMTIFPHMEFDMINVNVAFKPGSGEVKTKETLKKFEQAVWNVNKNLVEKYSTEDDSTTFIKYVFSGVGNAFNGLENGSHAGNLFITMRNMEDSPVSTFQIVNMIRKEIGPVPEAEKYTVGGQNRWGSPVSISLLGKDSKEIKLASEFLVTRLNEFDELKNIQTNNATGKKEILIDLKPKAYFLGMDHATISAQIREAFYGAQAQRLQKGKDELRIWIRYPKVGRISLGQMEKMKIKTPKGSFPLTELVDYNIERGPVSIKHYNSAKEIRVDADVASYDTPVVPILEKIKNNIVPELLRKYPGIKIKEQGQEKESREAMGQMIKFFAPALMAIVLLLMLHFRSTSKASMIIAMIPLSLVGVALGHWIHGKQMSMLSLWGVVALSGVVINDAVVFLAKYDSMLKEGYKVTKAVFEAGLSRFRPILLTTITTTAGLMPLITETSFQAQFLIPMAISLAYGVLVGTAFILLFLPVLILVLNDLRRGIVLLVTRKYPEAEDVEHVVIDKEAEIE